MWYLECPSSEFCVMAIWESLGNVGNRSYICWRRWWEENIHLHLHNRTLHHEYQLHFTIKIDSTGFPSNKQIHAAFPSFIVFYPSLPNHLTHTTYPQQPTRMTSTRRCIRLNGPLWSTTSRTRPWRHRLLPPPRIRWGLGGAMVKPQHQIWISLPPQPLGYFFSVNFRWCKMTPWWWQIPVLYRTTQGCHPSWVVTIIIIATPNHHKVPLFLAKVLPNINPAWEENQVSKQRSHSMKRSPRISSCLHRSQNEVPIASSVHDLFFIHDYKSKIQSRI